MSLDRLTKGVNLNSHLLRESLAPLDKSTWPKIREAVRAQVTAYHNYHISQPKPKVLDVEIQKGWEVPGTDWVFHYRLDALLDCPEFGGNVVMDHKTIGKGRAADKAKLRKLYEHDLQVNAYARAENSPVVIMSHSVKSGIRLKKGQSVEDYGQELLEIYSDKPDEHFFDLVIVPTHVDEVDWELNGTVDRMEWLRGHRNRSIKNRKSCGQCPFFDVCNGMLDLQDDRFFEDKEQAVEGGRYLSVSQIHQFQTCERSWQHSYMDWRTPTGQSIEALEHGKLFHDCMEVWWAGINAVQAEGGAA